MSVAKDHIKQLINSLPEDSSYEEILREVAFARMVKKGLEDSRENRTISNEEMEHRIKTWRK
ncbi:MAG: hypothetical protein HND53_09085 [Proteobacteria bacterium]|nr:hypothetical protein [Pseudomonadota bacterium]NOG60639.1 hypothetical protein [Pseudomonadota bacterium]